MKSSELNMPTPSKTEVEKYLKQWHTLENYVLQEKSLNKLFFKVVPENKEIEDILIKAATLNDFYSTHVYNIFAVAKKMLTLNIDERLDVNDLSLVHDIADNYKCFYSFATKYCSHHKPNIYPIYDSYVEKILWYFKKRDDFADFKRTDLKDYPTFKRIYMGFAKFYGIDDYTVKELDRYLWQLGKEYLVFLCD